MRFSSNGAPTDPDLGSTLGTGLKLFGIPDEKALGGQGETADLIMQLQITGPHCSLTDSAAESEGLNGV